MAVFLPPHSTMKLLQIIIKSSCIQNMWIVQWSAARRSLPYSDGIIKYKLSTMCTTWNKARQRHWLIIYELNLIVISKCHTNPMFTLHCFISNRHGGLLSNSDRKSDPSLIDILINVNVKWETVIISGFDHKQPLHEPGWQIQSQPLLLTRLLIVQHTQANELLIVLFAERSKKIRKQRCHNTTDVQLE